MIRIAVIGAGYMGSAHTRVLKRISTEYPELLSIEYIVDVDYNRARRASILYGGKPLKNIDEIPRNSIDLAFIAAPTEYHYQLFQKLVEKDVHGFFIEKPMTSSLNEAYDLLKLVEENDLWVSVGHIERFNPAVRKLHRHIHEGWLGEILTMISRRVGPFTARVKNTSVIYDLGIHEIDNSLAIYRKLPLTIRSYTLENLVTRLTDYALILLGYDKGFSSLEVNRVTPFKQRIMYLTGSRGVAFLDYMEQRLIIHDNEHEVIVNIKREEPLYIEDLAVIKAYNEKRNPPIDPYQAFTGIYLCELATKSTRENKEIVLEEEEKYNEYKDILAKGIEGFKKYVSNL